MAAPSLTVARQRVDNYAAGFLKAGAQAVIADGHRGPEDYIRALFTTKQSIASLWRNQPNFHGHESSFASSRTPGATAYMDPDTTTGGYYRSMVAQPGLTSDDVTGASGAGTTDDPSNLIVPGNAQVVGDGAQLFDDATLDPAGLAVAGTVASGARMRVLAEAPADPVTGATPVQVQGIDDPDLTGWMDASALVPKDSTAPALWNVAASTRISPNGDGRSDSASLTARVSETADWRFRIKAPGGATIVDRTGHGTAVDLSWDALTGGAAVADGAYTWSLQATDTWENGPTTKTGTITVDTKAPSLTAVTPPAQRGALDLAQWRPRQGIDDLGDDDERDRLAPAQGGRSRRCHRPEHDVQRQGRGQRDGHLGRARTSHGAVVPDGTYKITLTPRDTAGTDGKAVTRSLVVDTSLGDVDASKTLFFPQDGDGLAKTTTLRFTLTRPAVVTWTLVDADGRRRADPPRRRVAPGGPGHPRLRRQASGRHLPAAWRLSIDRHARRGWPLPSSASTGPSRCGPSSRPRRTRRPAAARRSRSTPPRPRPSRATRGSMSPSRARRPGASRPDQGLDGQVQGDPDDQDRRRPPAPSGSA